jgi:hypothetical protein
VTKGCAGDSGIVDRRASDLHCMTFPEVDSIPPDVGAVVMESDEVDVGPKEGHLS